MAEREPDWIMHNAMESARILEQLTQVINNLWRAGNQLEYSARCARTLANKLSAELDRLAHHAADAKDDRALPP